MAVLTPPAQAPERAPSAGDLAPLTYAIRDVRAAVLTDAAATTVGADLLRLLLFAVALPILGYLAFRATERQARRSGALGQY